MFFPACHVLFSNNASWMPSWVKHCLGVFAFSPLPLPLPSFSTAFPHMVKVIVIMIIISLSVSLIINTVITICRSCCVSLSIPNEQVWVCSETSGVKPSWILFFRQLQTNRMRSRYKMFTPTKLLKIKNQIGQLASQCSQALPFPTFEPPDLQVTPFTHLQLHHHHCFWLWQTCEYLLPLWRCLMNCWGFRMKTTSPSC